MGFAYDVAVLGGGASGLAAAASAGLLGAKVVLIERNALGGECTWTGCIPSKTLLHLASAPSPDFEEAMRRVRATRQDVYDREDAPPNLARYGVEIVRACARFVDPHTVALQGDDGCKNITARWFVIATGSRPKRLLHPDDLTVLDNESIWELECKPERMLVVGGGPVGIEIAHAFARFGVKITVVAPEDRILPHDDEECAAILQRRLSAEGIAFVFGASVEELQRRNGTIRACLSSGAGIDADAVFVAIGRESRTENLGLENAGVAVRDGKVVVDRHMRTTRRNIYAAGDVATNFRFTHVGERMGIIAISHALLRLAPRLSDDEMTWVTFTEPELAQVGLTEAQARKRNLRHEVFRFPYERLDRAMTDDTEGGLVKIVAGRGGRILGASIVGSRAGESIAELALARKHGIKLSALSGTLHAYPTYALANRRAADEWLLAQLSPLVLRAIRVFARLHGKPAQRSVG
jgi:pyruvate/2-oxoglutarate dehydrogenase complex dihydrolipoamide dehydrogenase (E3) component